MRYFQKLGFTFFILLFYTASFAAEPDAFKMTPQFTPRGLIGTKHEPTKPILIQPSTEQVDYKNWLNPTGEIPENGFKAVYFNRARKGEITHSEFVSSISANYAFSAFHGIPSERFAAYWVGKISFDVPTTLQLSIDEGWSKTNIKINGTEIYKNKKPSKSFKLQFEPGEHVIEVEHINQWHTVNLKATLDEIKPTVHPSQVKEVIDTLGLDDVDLYYVATRSSGTSNNTVRVTIPDGIKPVILWLGSYHAIDWKIDSHRKIEVAIVSSYIAGSRVLGDFKGLPLHVSNASNSYRTKASCSCPNAHFYCDNKTDLLHTRDKIREITGYEFLGYAVGSDLIRTGMKTYDEKLEAEIRDARKQVEHIEKLCKKEAAPVFEELFE